MTYLEDIVVGSVKNFGHYRVNEVEIISFAKRYDDQPFHTDAKAARGSIYGGLIASAGMSARCSCAWPVMLVSMNASPMAWALPDLTI